MHDLTAIKLVVALRSHLKVPALVDPINDLAASTTAIETALH